MCGRWAGVVKVGRSGEGEWQAKGRLTMPLGHRQYFCVPSRQQRCTQSPGHWQQSDTTSIQISAPQWLHRPCNTPRQFYRVHKKLSVKADLAIYSHIAS